MKRAELVTALEVIQVAAAVALVPLSVEKILLSGMQVDAGGALWGIAALCLAIWVVLDVAQR